MSSDLTSPSNLELAREAALRPIAHVAEELGLEPGEILPFGHHMAKIELSALERRATASDGKLVCVTAITPTKAGEGKTTTAISLADGLARVGARPLLCLREPSLGPVFGIKGGGAGGGRAQVAPMEEINLHFTGDIHAIGAANNLLAAMLEAHLMHGNALGLDPHSITWRRCLDMNDRALRQIVVGLGGRANGRPRETGFDITAASEVMGIVAVARDLADLRRRLGEITVGQTFEGEPVTAEQLRAAGPMAVLLRDALKPNLVQTLEGNPAFIHTGPFGNIALGNSSLVGALLGLKLADYVVTESGFGSDMGFEKLVDVVCRLGGLQPAAVVVVATARALKLHGGDAEGGLDAIERGSNNLAAHLRIVREFGLDAVVAVNRFPTDSNAEVEAVKRLALEHGALAAEANEAPTRGGDGASDLAEAASRTVSVRYAYELDDPATAKIEAIARRIYGAEGVVFSPQAQARLAALKQAGLAGLPFCMAKTHLSLSHDPTVAGSDRLHPARAGHRPLHRCRLAGGPVR